MLQKRAHIAWESIYPPPPPRLERMRGPHAYSPFLGKGGIFGNSLWKISRESPEMADCGGGGGLVVISTGN